MRRNRVLLFVCFILLPAVVVVDGERVVYSPRVIGGSDADISQQRHQLSLRLNAVHSCGAALISATRAATVAHCVGQAVSAYSVLAGSSDYTDESCSTCTVRTLTSYSRYPEFVDDALLGYPGDVAVVMFSAIGSNSAIGYIAMATTNDGDYTGEACTITGWGRTTSSGPLSTLLQVGDVTVLANAECNSAWPSTTIATGQICFNSPTVTACAGDDGGPVVCKNKLVGMMSWGTSNCSPTYPYVNTRVSEYKVWIDGQ